MIYGFKDEKSGSKGTRCAPAGTVEPISMNESGGVRPQLYAQLAPRDETWEPRLLEGQNPAPFFLLSVPGEEAPLLLLLEPGVL